MFQFFGSSGPVQFDELYQCYSMAVIGRDLEDGDKILLPQSALETLARSNIKIFSLTLTFVLLSLSFLIE